MPENQNKLIEKIPAYKKLIPTEVGMSFLYLLLID